MVSITRAILGTSRLAVWAVLELLGGEPRADLAVSGLAAAGALGTLLLVAHPCSGPREGEVRQSQRQRRSSARVLARIADLARLGIDTPGTHHPRCERSISTRAWAAGLTVPVLGVADGIMERLDEAERDALSLRTS